MNNKLYSLCFTCLLFILLDAVPLKLIPGDSSVVKKDGVTHTISKYYVVPNDFKLNNGSGSSSATVLRSNTRYSKSMDLETVTQRDGVEAANDQLDEYRVAIDTKRANLNSDSDVTEAGNVYQADENNAEEWATTTTQVTPEPEDLGNLQVEPMINPFIINNTNSAENKPDYIDVDNNAESTFETNTTTDTGIDITTQQMNALFTEFAIVIHEHAAQNLRSFWKVFINYVDATSDEREKLIRIEKLLVLLDIFTNLYKAIQLQIPIDFIIDDIVNIIEPTDPENIDSNRNDPLISRNKHKQVKTNTQKECIRTCLQKHSENANLDSKIVPISETDDRVANGDIELENDNLKKYLPRRDSDIDIWVKLPASGTGSNHVTGSDKPINIQRTQLVQPDYVISERKLINSSGTPDGFNTRSSISTPNLARDDTADTTELPWTIEARTVNNPPWTIENNIGQPPTIKNKIKNPSWTIENKVGLPWTVEDRSVNKLPWTIEDRTVSNPPWTIENKVGLPWTIEDRSENKLPWTVENKGGLPWIIEDRAVNKLPWTIDNKVGLPWTIEDRSVNNPLWTIQNKPVDNYPWHIEDKNLPFNLENKFGDIPTSLHPSDSSELKINDDDILIDSNNNPVTNTVNGVTVKDRFGKPYIYTYVINPTNYLHRGPGVTSNVFKINSGKYNNILETDFGKALGLSLSYDKNTDSQVLFTNGPQALQDYYTSKIKSELEKQSNINPTIPLPNTPSTESLINLGLENEYGVPAVQDISSNGEILLPNVPSTPFEPYLNLDIANGDISTFVDETNTDNTQSSYYNSKTKVANDKGTDIHQMLHPTVPYDSDYIKLDRGNNVPNYGGETTTDAEILLSNQHAGHKLHIIQQPSVGHQQPGNNYLQHLKATLAPSYQLFSVENLLKLHNALKNSKQINEFNVNEDRAVSNLRKIDNLLLILAEYLDESGTDRWYENIFYNVKKHQHPLQLYVQNLLRQKWLHELMLVLYKNNFNLNILNSPRLEAFLGSLRFPNYVLTFLEAEEPIDGNFENLNGFEETFGVHNVIPGKYVTHIIKENLGQKQIPENYETVDIVDNHRPLNEGNIFLNITEFDAGLDASEIIEILNKYLHYKNYIEKQENVINLGNKMKMFKQIVLYLREKGYRSSIVIDLIRKLYGAVYSVEGHGCSQPQHNDFVKNVYDVIVPVLRGSEG